MCGALVDMLTANGVKSVAVVYMDELFGLENYAALKVALKGTGIKMVEDKSYPLGMKDLSPVLRDQGQEPGRLHRLHLSARYHPGQPAGARRSASTRSSSTPRWAPRSRSTAAHDAANAEGVMGMGSWNPKTSAGAKAYFDAHVEKSKKEPDRWASGALLGRPGDPDSTRSARSGLDRKAIRDHVANTEHKPSSARSGSPAARTSARPARWASGRTASSRWSGRRRWPPPS